MLIALPDDERRATEATGTAGKRESVCSSETGRRREIPPFIRPRRREKTDEKETSLTLFSSHIINAVYRMKSFYKKLEIIVLFLKILYFEFFFETFSYLP